MTSYTLFFFSFNLARETVRWQISLERPSPPGKLRGNKNEALIFGMPERKEVEPKRRYFSYNAQGVCLCEEILTSWYAVISGLKVGARAWDCANEPI
jgi:hypothetical protein